MAARLRVGIAGVGGRMGRMLVEAVAATDDMVLVAASDRPESELVDAMIGGVMVDGRPERLFDLAEVVIDFTTPAASQRHAELAGATGKALLVGTTGGGGELDRAIDAAARSAPVLLAANTSLGVTLLIDLVRHATAALGPEWDVEIVETHHRHKVDAPSGTALALGDAAAAGRGVKLDRVAERGRDGHTGPRRTGAIGFASLRGGDVVGEHTVILAGPAERLELTHKAGDRRLFAAGAVRAARWLAHRAPGRYRMADLFAAG
jgi:4-hydroxy-tetrahydrodipicolinate reductase